MLIEAILIQPSNEKIKVTEASECDGNLPPAGNLVTTHMTFI